MFLSETNIKIYGKFTVLSKNKGLEIYAWCIMSSHVHLIISTKTGFILENILHDFRRHTAKNIVLAIRENPQESRREWLLKKFLMKDGINFFGN
jgi:REP element-mobilizing transposase RayT